MGAKLLQDVRQDLADVVQVCEGRKKQTNYLRTLINELVKGGPRGAPGSSAGQPGIAPDLPSPGPTLPGLAPAASLSICQGLALPPAGPRVPRARAGRAGPQASPSAREPDPGAPPVRGCLQLRFLGAVVLPNSLPRGSHAPGGPPALGGGLWVLMPAGPSLQGSCLGAGRTTQCPLA